MTMRLDIVTNDAGELVRREHARELGAGVVVALYRLAKLAQMHDLGNQAFVRQLEQAHQLIGEYGLRAGSNVSVLFADKATFVAGQLLKGSRGAYDAASELGALLERMGGSELHIERDITQGDLRAFAEQVSFFHRTGNAAQIRVPPRMHLRRVAEAARLRGVELEELTPDQRIVRAYASAVVIMRRFFEDLSAGRYMLPRRIKRIAQSLVDLSDATTASYLGVTEVRNANYDEAGRAVNTAILAVAIAREATQERTTLAQIAMAAMMHDVARPRALALVGAGGPPIPGMPGPTTLSEDQEDRLPAGTAAVLTALGRVNEPSITRTVLTFEALWLRRRTWLGPVYWGARPPTLQATIIAVARRYNDLLTPEPGLVPPTTDYAVAVLSDELTDTQGRTVLRMLVSALGLLPLGTVVQLSSGEVAEVIRGAKGLGDKARVRLLADASGAEPLRPIEIELAEDPRRTVVRVLDDGGWDKGLAGAPAALGPGPDSNDDVVIRAAPPMSVAPPAAIGAIPPPAPLLSAEAPGASRRDEDDRSASGIGLTEEHPSSSSMPSFGSSPSAVAEAMGRMIGDSLRPSTPAARDVDAPDRTVFQAKAPDGAVAARPTRSPPREPTARGNLAATPLSHVLVYMLDHALTGTVVFEGASAGGHDASDDRIFFINGVPAKIRLGDVVALLGEVLVGDGALEPKSLDQAVEGARRLGVLLGEYLVGHDLVSRVAVARGLEEQLLERVAQVVNLAPEVEYAYYRDLDLLEGWGGDVVVTHPLNPILASVRRWPDRARIRATLNRIGRHPLAVHPDADLSSLAVHGREKTVLDAIHARPMPLPQLFRQGLADEEVVSSLVYTLAVTRQFAFKGQKKGPMAARVAAWQSVLPPPSSVTPSASIASSSRPVPVTSSSVSPLAAGAAPPAPGRATRALTPAIRPSQDPRGRRTGPQIRPISVKRSTTVGTKPGAAPEARGAPSPRHAGAGALKPPPSPRDDAKTIARPSPALTDLAVARGAGSLPPGADRATPPRPLPKATGAASRPSRVATTMRGMAPAPAGDDALSDDAGGRSPVDVASVVRAPADPDATGPSDAIAIGDGLIGVEAALEAMSSFRLAEGALQRNDVAAAEAHARRAVASDPTQPDYVALLAWVRAQSGEHQPTQEAIRTMSKILIEDPSNEKALFYRGKLLVRTHRLPEALNDFNELLSTNPHHREAQTEVRELEAKGIA